VGLNLSPRDVGWIALMLVYLLAQAAASESDNALRRPLTARDRIACLQAQEGTCSLRSSSDMGG